MKISGLLPVIVIAVIWYCACNSIILNPADVIADVGDTVVSSRRSHRGAFGIDSQRILNESEIVLPRYNIGFVTSIDLEKNDDGTWYVHKCGLDPIQNMFDYLLFDSLYFTSPYPQQYELKVGDVIGFSAMLDDEIVGGNERYSYHHGQLVENISSQSVNYNIDNISGLSVPVKDRGSLTVVTGLIMAVLIHRNGNPEPDNPDDYLIGATVMKCADGNLYIVEFERHISKLPNIRPVNLPSPDAFGEGDIVSVIQTAPLKDYSFKPYPSFRPYYFRAYYKKFKRVVTQQQRAETAKSGINPNQQAVRDAESDAESAANNWFWFGGTCLGTTFLSCVACGLPSMAIAYFYEPAAPTSRLIGKSPEYVEIYQKTYKDKVRSHQVSRATWGCIVGSIGFLYLVGQGTSL